VINQNKEKPIRRNEMSKIIDLSLDIFPEMKLHPEIKNPVFTRTYDQYDHPYFPLVASQVDVFMHTGTHMDAPMHTIKGGRSVDKIEPSQLYGPAVKLDLSHIQPLQEVTLTDVKNAEAKLSSPIEPGDFVFLATLYNTKYWGKDDYWNMSPYTNEEVAKYLIEEKEARGLGYDFIEEQRTNVKDEDTAETPDEGIGFPVHSVVLGNDRYHVEYLINLEKITVDRFMVVVAPLKWVGLEASPVRVLAILDS
jgi:arylformamidase